MRKIVFLAFAFLTMQAQSQVINETLFNSNYWKSFDWNNLQKSSLWSMSSLLPYVPAANQNDGGDVPKALKYSISNLDGALFVFTLAYDGSNVSNGYFRTIFPKTRFDECKGVSERISNAFGITGEFIDNSYKFNANSSLQRHVYQWELGKSIAVLNCTYFNGDKRSESIVLTNKPNIYENKFEKIIHLSCQRNQRYVAIYEKNWTAIDPLVISIIPSEGVILDADGEVLGRAEVGKSAIRINVDLKNGKVLTTISRLDGRLTGIQTELGTGKQLFEIQGNCVVRNPAERRF